MRIKLEPQLGGHSSSEAVPVSIKGRKESDDRNSKKQKETAAPESIGGKVKMRRETKGRGGKSVVVLFDFTDPKASNPVNLRALCSELKNVLACGGTVEDGTVIVQSDDGKRIVQVLTRMGIIGVPAGGFSF